MIRKLFVKRSVRLAGIGVAFQTRPVVSGGGVDGPPGYRSAQSNNTSLCFGDERTSNASSSSPSAASEYRTPGQQVGTRPYVGLMTVTTVHTVGHGTLPADTFASLLEDVHVGRVVDVRSFPGSRRNPQFGREEMENWAPFAGLGYTWMRSLGGRRRPVAGSKHVALRHEAFRAYADYMETPAFLADVDELLAVAENESIAVMCSESVWWRCHRRLLADHLVLVRGIKVVHLMHDGRLTSHVPTDGVRLTGGALAYDVGIAPPLSAD
jgi:hypothetical protein